MSDKVSVIIPCYKVEKYVERCLESLERQTIGIGHMEIICVDDASSDGTEDILRSWEKKYPGSIKVVLSERNNRQGAARNIGMQYASGDWVSFVDSDDWVEPDFYEKLLRRAEGKTYDIVACKFMEDTSVAGSGITEVTDKGTGEAVEYFVTDDMVRKEIIRRQPFGKVYPSIIRRAFLQMHRIAFPERLMYEDIYFKTLLHLEVSRGAVIDEALYHFFKRPEGERYKPDELYYADYLTVLMFMWKEWQRRGYFSRYENELMAQFIKEGYLGFLKVLFARKGEVPYTYFLLIRELTLTLTPAADKKHYLKNSPYFTDAQKVWISALWRDVDKADFEEIAAMTLEAGGI